MRLCISFFSSILDLRVGESGLGGLSRRGSCTVGVCRAEERDVRGILAAVGFNTKNVRDRIVVCSHK